MEVMNSGGELESLHDAGRFKYTSRLKTGGRGSVKRVGNGLTGERVKNSNEAMLWIYTSKRAEVIEDEADASCFIAGGGGVSLKKGQ